MDEMDLGSYCGNVVPRWSPTLTLIKISWYSNCAVYVITYLIRMWVIRAFPGFIFEHEHESVFLCLRFLFLNKNSSDVLCWPLKFPYLSRGRFAKPNFGELWDWKELQVWPLSIFFFFFRDKTVPRNFLAELESWKVKLGVNVPPAGPSFADPDASFHTCCSRGKMC